MNPVRVMVASIAPAIWIWTLIAAIIHPLSRASVIVMAAGLVLYAVAGLLDSVRVRHAAGGSLRGDLR
jgi:hypothetical protein